MPRGERKIIKISSVGKILNEPRRGRSTQGGFTLLELILVLFLIGIIAGLTTPFIFSTLERIQLQSDVREVASALRFARSEAITLKTLFTFNGDASQGRYWLTNPGAEQSTKTKILDPAVRMVHITSDQQTVRDGIFVIRFYPQGSSSGGVIHLKPANPEGSDISYAITIDPITGSSQIHQETR